MNNKPKVVSMSGDGQVCAWKIKTVKTFDRFWRV